MFFLEPKWGNTVGLGRIKVQYWPSPSLCSGGQPLLHLYSLEWRQYSPIYMTQTYHNHIVSSENLEFFWLTNAFWYWRGQENKAIPYWVYVDPFSTRIGFLLTPPVHVLVFYWPLQYMYWFFVDPFSACIGFFVDPFSTKNAKVQFCY